MVACNIVLVCPLDDAFYPPYHRKLDGRIVSHRTLNNRDNKVISGRVVARRISAEPA